MAKFNPESTTLPSVVGLQNERVKYQDSHARI